MSSTPGAAGPAAIEQWLRDLGLEVGPAVERDGITAWDIVLDGRRRRDLRVTVIQDPSLGVIAWAHLAPPLGDAMRRTLRTLLRWNDEFPFAKLSVADDGRPILAVEIPGRWLDGDELGLALARISAIADHVFDDSRAWLWIGGRIPAGYGAGPGRNAGLLARYRERLGELVEPTADEGSA